MTKVKAILKMGPKITILLCVGAWMNLPFHGLLIAIKISQGNIKDTR
jgi:hypothetical protein